MSISLAYAAPVILSATNAFKCVSSHEFSETIMQAMQISKYHKTNLDWRGNEGYEQFDCWLMNNGQAGYALTKPKYAHNKSLELINVFSLCAGAGNGHSIVTHAKSQASQIHLDCYDGALVRFYQSHGFTETHRLPDWYGGPNDVVYMHYRK